MPTLFAGDHTTVHDYLGGAKNLIIPEYQREYSWGQENVDQLIDDIKQGISRLDKTVGIPARLDNGSKFLGCVIQWERDARPNQDYVVTPGTNFLTRVMEVIDGQQRISTICLLLCETHFQLSELAGTLNRGIPEENELSAFVERVVQFNWLLPRFSRAGSSGAVPQHRPILVRQGPDKWIHAGTAQYASDVASYIHQALASGRPLRRPTEIGKDICEVVAQIEKRLREYASDHIDVLSTTYDQSELLSELYSGHNPTDIKAYLDTNPANAATIEAIVRIISLVHYLLNYCAFTVITSPNENTALDMFQSLNATGVQLTAVQLLKPYISQSFRNAGSIFNTDATYTQFEDANSWLNSGRNSSSKTTQFFLKFGLGVFGDEPMNSLSSQRTWALLKFRNFTSDGTNLSKTKEFIRLMSHYVAYLKQFVFGKNDLFQATPASTPGSRSTYDKFKLTHVASRATYSLSDPAITALMFLIEAKHDLAHSILALYFAKFQEATPLDALPAKQEFEMVVLKVAACFVLWRSTFGERYPDDAYRRVLSKQCYSSPAFTGRANQVGRALIKELSRGMRAMTPRVRFADWPAHLAKCMQYRSGANAILRFILILAAHRKVPIQPGMPSFTEHGLVSADPAGPDYLFPDVWLGSDYKSLEHVAPQRLLGFGAHIDHWNATFATASDSVNSIGNLTLLSVALNASTPEDTVAKTNHYEGLVAPGAVAGVTPTAAALMAASPLLTHLVPVYIRLLHWLADLNSTPPVAPSQNVWDEQFIARRAANIASMILADMWQWLRSR